MNTNGLAKHYALLSPAERLSLMLAAVVRGDDLEHARLIDSAPRVIFRVPHTFGRAMALREVCEQHRMEQLELAALFFGAQAVADGRMTDTARLLGYLMNVNVEGWQRFCEREQIDLTASTALMPGGEALRLAAKAVEGVAFTEGEVLEYAQRTKHSLTAVKTAESVAAELQATYQARVAWWE
ncbi:MAG: hypothetical protein L0241_26350 [Planctomycetia bacterium]|nr:hypothetical protein [Planctomycetia bacterium]